MSLDSTFLILNNSLSYEYRRSRPIPGTGSSHESLRRVKGKEGKTRRHPRKGSKLPCLSMIWTKRFVYLLLVMLSLITGFRQLNTAKRRFDLMKRYVAKG